MIDPLPFTRENVRCWICNVAYGAVLGFVLGGIVYLIGGMGA